MGTIIEEKIVLENLREYKNNLMKCKQLQNRITYLWESFAMQGGQKPMDGMPKPKGGTPQTDRILEMIGTAEEELSVVQSRIAGMEAALELLDKDEFDSVEARLINGYTWARAEAEIGLSQKTIRTRLKTALEKLKTGEF